ncbi:MAG: hypothetical protein ACXADB_09490 [Candidatus Hermodarchaeia archaeon]|jgi:hypothetical protein
MEKIRTRFIVEMLGRPKEVLSKALEDLIKEMKKDGRKVENETYSKPKKVGKLIFSAFVEFEMICEGLEDLIGSIIDYAPTTVELISPEKIDIGILNLQEVLNDLTARLHELDKQVKIYQSNNIILQRKLEEIKNS